MKRQLKDAISTIYHIAFGFSFFWTYISNIFILFQTIGEGNYIGATIFFFLMHILSILGGLLWGIIYGTIVVILLSPLLIMYFTYIQKRSV